MQITRVTLNLVLCSDARISASTSASIMLRFHTMQANANISASARKKKNFDPCACAYACVMLASLVKTRLNIAKFNLWGVAHISSLDYLCYHKQQFFFPETGTLLIFPSIMNLMPRTLSFVTGIKSVSLFVHHISCLSALQPWDKPVRHKVNCTCFGGEAARRMRRELWNISRSSSAAKKSLLRARLHTASYAGYHFKGKISEGPESIFGSQ